MGLPKIDMPLFELEVPSTKQKVKYRPFTVKEEKILLIAQESRDIDQIISSIKQIINNCYQEVDVEKLTMFDLEYLLLLVRAISVDNALKFTIRDTETGDPVEFEIDINDISITFPEEHSQSISLDEGYTMIMKYPSIKEISILVDMTKGEKEGSNTYLEIMISCMDKLVRDDEVYKIAEFSKEEINTFVESLSAKSLSRIKKFFETMPKLRYEKEYKTKDGRTKTLVLEGTETFFI